MNNSDSRSDRLFDLLHVIYRLEKTAINALLLLFHQWLAKKKLFV